MIKFGDVSSELQKNNLEDTNAYKEIKPQEAISKETADAYNPKVVRSTMGAIFRVNIIESNNVLETLKIADKKVLLVVKEFDENLILASRNLKNLVLILADEINVLDIVGTDVMVVTEDALKFIEEVLK